MFDFFTEMTLQQQYLVFVAFNVLAFICACLMVKKDFPKPGIFILVLSVFEVINLGLAGIITFMIWV